MSTATRPFSTTSLLAFKGYQMPTSVTEVFLLDIIVICFDFEPLLTMSLLKRSSILSHKCFYLFEECVFPPNAAFITVVGADRLRELPCLSLC